MIKTIIICGPTASGKTDISVALAQKFGCEIVCADSMQIYRELQIATARPTTDEMCGIPHRLFASVSVEEEYSVADFCVDAKAEIDNIIKRNSRPMLCGGTGLYIDSLINGTDFTKSSSDKSVMEKLVAEYNQYGAEYMHQKLQKIDIESAEKIHTNNVKRVLRALEIYEVSGQPKSVVDKLALESRSIYKPLYIGITYNDRQKLYNRIEKRVDLMIENGIIDEVRDFYKLNPCKTAMAAIGCKEFKPYLDGVMSLDECINILKTATRRYAKRQLTWFNRNKQINWLYPDILGKDGCVQAATELIEAFYK